MAPNHGHCFLFQCLEGWISSTIVGQGFYDDTVCHFPPTGICGPPAGGCYKYTTPPTSTFGRRAFTIACPTAWDDGTVYRTPSGILTSLYIAVLARRAYWVVFWQCAMQILPLTLTVTDFAVLVDLHVWKHTEKPTVRLHFRYAVY